MVGWLIMLPGWEDEDDNYSGVVEILTKLIDDSDRLEDLRLAVAMSKCERGELWPGRIEPEIDLFQKRLTRTRSILRKKIPRKNLRFYALSTFGVLDPERDPRPNRISIPGDKEGAVLRYPGLWKPYNMIAPLYWLNTGKRLGGNV